MVFIRIPIGTQVGLRLGDIVLDGDPEGDLGHLWITITLIHENGFWYFFGDIVLDGDPAPIP